MSNQFSLPQWVFRFLQWICPDHLYEEIEGDLIQKFNKDIKVLGEKKAKRRLIWNVIRFCRPGIVLRNKFAFRFNELSILSHFVKVSLRRFRTDKISSGINVIGLSISMATGLIIWNYAGFEFSYDRFNVNAEQLYRLTTTTYQDDEIISRSSLSPQFINAMVNNVLPEVLASTQLISTRSWFDCKLRSETGQQSVVFNERNLFYTDPSFLSMFSWSLIRGDLQTVLAEPFTAVLSNSSAMRYFGNDDPVGKVVHLKGSGEENDYVVTGVFDDLPGNSHMEIDILLSSSSLDHNPYASNLDTYTYMRLKPNANLDVLRSKLSDVVKKHFANVGNPGIVMDFQPIVDIHLYSNFQDELKPGGNYKVVYFLILIALVILAIAWINYINMVTSRAMNRVKEIGVRKVSGATRSLIIKQFVTESLVMNLICIVLAIVICKLSASTFFGITGISFSYQNFIINSTTSGSLLVVIFFCVGVFLSGVYPASIIARCNPSQVLKGRFIGSQKGATMQKSLIVFQFTCSVILMIGVVTIQSQFNFMQRETLGIDITKTLVLKAPTTVDSSYQRQLIGFKNQLRSLHLINNITTSSAIPGEAITWLGAVRREHDKSFKQGFAIHVVDDDFIDAYKLQLLAGRNFQVSEFPGAKFGTKTESILVNREAIKQLNFQNADDAIGTIVYWDKNKCKVIGVIDDFHQQSLRSVLGPAVFTVNNGPKLSLKLGDAANAENMTASIALICRYWSKYFPDEPFDYFFLDEFYHNQYSDDVAFKILFNLFCGIAILISILGLFGLTSFKIKQRKKEIGVRKVLGASIGQITALISREFMIVALIANIIAWPVAYLVMNNWLMGFAYHVQMNLLSFAGSGITIVLIAFLITAIQSINAANANPMDNLRSE